MAQNPTSYSAIPSKRQKLTPIEEARLRHAYAKSTNTPATAQRYEAIQKAKPSTRRKGGLQRPRKALPSLDTVARFQQEIPESLSQLHYHANILQQLYVRHKNQHRGQVWFKQLNLVRRATRDLLDVEVELFGLQHRSKTGVNVKAEDVRKGLEEQKSLTTRRGELEEWIREILVPQCYVRFSVLVADGDGSFANLGVVLVGLVGSIADIVGTPVIKDDSMAGNMPVGKKHEVAREIAGMKRHEEEIGERLKAAQDGHEQDDFGTVIKRKAAVLQNSDLKTRPKKRVDLHQEEHTGRAEDFEMEDERTMRKIQSDEAAAPEVPAPATKSGASAATNFKRQKRKVNKEKGNAIDDLFAGFG